MYIYIYTCIYEANNHYITIQLKENNIDACVCSLFVPFHTPFLSLQEFAQLFALNLQGSDGHGAMKISHGPPVVLLQKHQELYGFV